MTRVCEADAKSLIENFLESKAENIKWKIHNWRNAS
jgi:hypothetical protein